MGTFPEDSGSDMRDMCDSMRQNGAVLESDVGWNPDTAPQDIAEDLSGLNPPSAPFYHISGYQRVGGAGLGLVASIIGALQANNPVAVGLQLYPSFSAAQGDGRIPLPQPDEQPIPN